MIGKLTNGTHEIFSKSYKPAKLKPDLLEFMFDNTDGFFTGLPSSDTKVKRNSAYCNLVPKEIRDQFELRVVEHKISKMQAKADKMR